LSLLQSVRGSTSEPPVPADENPYYAYTEMPEGVNPGNPDPVVTVGVKTTVVNSDNLDEESVHRIIKVAFADI
jgi:TRAP-type uncharacterized transport system substrate-binding protein